MLSIIKKYFSKKEEPKKLKMHICEPEPLSAEKIQELKHLGSWSMDRECKHCQKTITQTYII